MSMVVHWPSWWDLLLPLHNIHKHSQTLSVNMSNLYMEMVWFGTGGCWGGRGTSVALRVRDVLSHICTYTHWALEVNYCSQVETWPPSLAAGPLLTKSTVCVFVPRSLSHTHAHAQCTAAVFLHWAIHLWAPAVNSTGNWKHKHAPAQRRLTSFLRSNFWMLYFSISHNPALADVTLNEASSEYSECVLRDALCANAISTLSWKISRSDSEGSLLLT